MVAFVATNLDDLFLLVAWYAAAHRGRDIGGRDIVLGQYLGIGALFVASLAASLLALAIPAGPLKWLGLVPVALGLLMLVRKASPEEEAPAASGWLPVAAVTVANGADNLAVYVPLFAMRPPQAIAVMAVVFAGMLALWCAAARWLVHHPGAGAPLRRRGPRLVPWLLIALGLWIVAGGL